MVLITESSDIAPIHRGEPAPARALDRAGRRKYLWAQMQPGDWFQFSTQIKASSARVMATEAGHNLAMKFRVYRGLDDGLYCIRIDGLPEDQREPGVRRDAAGTRIMPSAPLHHGPPPAVREEIPVHVPTDEQLGIEPGTDPSYPAPQKDVI